MSKRDDSGFERLSGRTGSDEFANFGDRLASSDCSTRRVGVGDRANDIRNLDLFVRRGDGKAELDKKLLQSTEYKVLVMYDTQSKNYTYLAPKSVGNPFCMSRLWNWIREYMVS